MKSLIKVVEESTGEVLFQCPVNESDKAYAYAVDMERMGIGVTIQAPSTPETLANELGKSSSQIDELKEQINSEIESHSPKDCIA